jgi:hypothetical protein
MNKYKDNLYSDKELEIHINCRGVADPISLGGGGVTFQKFYSNILFPFLPISNLCLDDWDKTICLLTKGGFPVLARSSSQLAASDA